METRTGKSGLQFWLLFAAIFVAAYMLRQVLFPFLVAFIAAYLLDPPLDWLERKKLDRGIASALLLICMFGLVIVGLLLLYPVLERQLLAAMELLPGYMEKAEKLLAPYVERLSSMSNEEAKELVRKGAERMGSLPLAILKYLYNVVVSSFTGVTGMVTALFDMIVIPVAAFYFMRDIDGMKDDMEKMIPPRHRPKLREVGSEMNKTLSAFLRGQITVSLILAVLYSLGLFLLEIPMGLFVGLLTGFANMVPYLPLLVGLLPSLVLCWFEFGFDWHMVGILGLFAGVQLLEGFFITPKIMGKSIGLHPVAIMVALLLFGSLFGIVGLIVAVPAAALVGVLWRHFNKYYKESPYYNQPAEDAATEPEKTTAVANKEES